MKRFFVSVVILILFTLAACQGKEEEVLTPPLAPTATTVPTKTPTPTVTPTPVPTATPTPEPINTYAKGTMTETGFQSEWLNLRFVAPEDVTMATAEELAVLMGIGADLLFEEQADVMMAFAEMTLVYEMMAKHNQGANLMLAVEVLAESNRNITPEQYLEAMLQTMERSNVEYDSDGVFHKRTLAGEEYVGVYTTVTYGTGGTVQQENLVRKKENRMVLLATSYTAGKENNAEYLLSLLEQYNPETPLPTSVPLIDTYEKGIITDNGFESEWMDLQFVAPEGMTMATQKEMDALILQGADMLYGDDAYADYTNFQMVYEMQANGEYGIPSVQVTVEKAAYKNMTAEQYAGFAKQSFGLIATAAGASSYEIHDNLYSVEIAGREYVGTAVDMTFPNGLTLCQDYCIREKDGRIIVIAFSYVKGMESYLGDMLIAFRPYTKELCTAAYLGYLEDEYAEFMTFAAQNGIFEQYPFVEEISESNTVLASGGEWYALVPRDETVRFTVSEAMLDEATYQLVPGKELLALEAGERLLLRGNVSDIFPSFMVTITAADGTVITYAPGLSLRDGALNSMNGVQDITVYPEGQLEEEY